MTAAQKCVLMALADRADDNGTGWPSIPWISEWTCFGRTAVIEALKWLESNGFIRIEKASGRNNLCTINLEFIRRSAPPNPSATRTTTRPGDGLVRGDESGVDHASEALNQSVSRTGPAAEPVRETNYHPSAKRTTTRPGDGLTRPPDGPDTSLNTNKTSDRHGVKAISDAGTKKRTNSDAEVQQGFDDFWMVYPRKVSKPAALKAWNRLRPDAELQARILAALAVQRRLEDWKKDGGKFIPHPATYLNNARWEDELPGGAARAIAGAGPEWFRAAGFEHVAEAQNARCHIGNFREFKDGKRVALEAQS